jgi:hypothetical protein
MKPEDFLKTHASFEELPSLQQWKVASKIPGSVNDPGRAADLPLQRIDWLVGALEGNVQGGQKPYLLSELFFSTMWWMNHRKDDPTGLRAIRRRSVLSLNLCAANKLAATLGCPISGLAHELQQIYGKQMDQSIAGDHGRTEADGADAEFLKRKEIGDQFGAADVAQIAVGEEQGRQAVDALGAEERFGEGLDGIGRAAIHQQIVSRARRVEVDRHAPFLLFNLDVDLRFLGRLERETRLEVPGDVADPDVVRACLLVECRDGDASNVRGARGSRCARYS